MSVPLLRRGLRPCKLRLKVTRFAEYFRGVSFKGGRIHIATTGAAIALDKTFWQGLVAVLKIYGYFFGLSFKRMFTRSKPEGTIAFFPQTPGPWYNIWQVIRLAGLKTVSDASRADYIFIFEDKTYAEFDPDCFTADDAIKINDQIGDISKEHVADVFEKVFRYSLRVDPVTHVGPAIEKSNVNGTHDGRVIDCPIASSDIVSGQSYQRLVDSTFDGTTSEDLRIAYVLGEIALVYHKYKPLSDRFGTHYLRVDVKRAADVFSQDEINLIIKFCETMGLDFGAVDVMRDKHDGRIYIVDVNKTCMPVLSLTLKTQIESQQKISDALLRGLAKT